MGAAGQRGGTHWGPVSLQVKQAAEGKLHNSGRSVTTRRGEMGWRGEGGLTGGDICIFMADS